MIDLDLSIPVNQVRVLIGDIEIEYISDDNLQFLLQQHKGNVLKAAVPALDYILATLAYHVREEVGYVKVHWQQMYETVAKRKADIEQRLRYANTKNIFYFGGTVKSDVRRNRENPEHVGLGFEPRTFYELTNKLGIDLEDPYLLVRR